MKLHKTDTLVIYLITLFSGFIFNFTMLQAQEKENAEFKLAVNLYNDGMYDLALDQLKNFIAAYSTTSQGVEARFYLGLTQMKLKQYDEARLTFQNFALAYIAHQKAPEAWMKVGEAFLAMKNDKEAASAFERINTFHPKNPLAAEGLLKAAELYKRIGEFESAKKALRKIIQDYPTSSNVPAARLENAELFLLEDQIEFAEREARFVIENDAPENLKAEALLLIGKLQAAASFFDEAKKSFKTVTTEYKSVHAKTNALYNLGVLEKSAGNFDAAIEYFKKIIDEEKADDTLKARAIFESGSAYAALKDAINAQKSYEMLISTFPNSSLNENATLEAGKAALANRKPKEALKYAELLVSSTSAKIKPKALILAADAAISLGQYGKAAAYYINYIDQFPDDPYVPEVYMKLAETYHYRLGDRGKAISTYDRFIQKYPQSKFVATASRYIAICEEQIKDFDAAWKTLIDIKNNYPASIPPREMTILLDSLHWKTSEERENLVNESLEILSELSIRKPAADIMFHIGKIYFLRMKDFTSAVKYFSAAIDSGLNEEDFIDAYYYRARAVHCLAESDTSKRGQAIIYYDSFLKQFPESKWSDSAAYYSLLLKSIKYSKEEKLAAFNDFLNKYPNTHFKNDILIYLGNESLKNQTYGNAIYYFSSIIKYAPASSAYYTEALYGRCHTYILMGETDSTAMSLAILKSELNTDNDLIAPDLPPFPESSNSSGVEKTHYPRRDFYVAQALYDIVAALQQKQNNYSAGLEMCKIILSEFYYTSFADTCEYLLPELLLLNGNYDDAINTAKDKIRHIETSPFTEKNVSPYNNPEMLTYVVASAYEKKGDFQTAIREYNNYLLKFSISGRASKAYMSLGAIARSQGKNEKASLYFKKAGELGSDNIFSSDMADLFYQTEQYDEASKQYLKLVQSTNEINLRQQYFAKAIVSTMRANRLAEAQKMVTEFGNNYGKDKNYIAEFDYETANYYYRKQDFVNSKKYFRTVTDKYEDTKFAGWGHYYLGKILEIDNKLDDAAKKYEYILKKFSDSDIIPRVLLSLGNMNFNVERYEDAIRLYQKIIEKPNEAGDILPYAMNNLIEAYESTKLYDAALRLTQDFITRYPNDESIIDKKIKIGTLYTKLSYYDQAVVHFQDLLGTAGSSLEAEIRYNIGEAYYYKGEYQQAILEFLKVPYLVSKRGKIDWTATSFYMAGQAYEKMSKFDEAIGMYQQIIDRSGIDITFKTAAKKEIDRVKLIIKKGPK